MIVINEFIMSSNQEVKQHSTTHPFSCSGRNKVNYFSVAANDGCISYILFWNIETSYRKAVKITTILTSLFAKPLFTKCCLAIIHALLNVFTNFGMTCLR